MAERAQIPRRVPAGGTPAKVLKVLDGGALQWVERAAADYQRLASRYLAQGIG